MTDRNWGCCTLKASDVPANRILCLGPAQRVFLRSNGIRLDIVRLYVRRRRELDVLSPPGLTDLVMVYLC
jgi:hypothetical protein